MDEDEKMNNRWFKAYKKYKGKHAYKVFVINLNKFIDLTSDAFTGCGSREEAWNNWVDYIKNEEEAQIYFKAVDSVTAYS